MSTRYVWGKYDKEYFWQYKDILSYDNGVRWYQSDAGGPNTLYGYCATAITKNSDGTYSLSGSIVELRGHVVFVDAKTYLYFARKRTTSEWYANVGQHSGGSYWVIKAYGNGGSINAELLSTKTESMADSDKGNYFYISDRHHRGRLSAIFHQIPVRRIPKRRAVLNWVTSGIPIRVPTALIPRPSPTPRMTQSRAKRLRPQSLRQAIYTVVQSTTSISIPPMGVPRGLTPGQRLPKRVNPSPFQRMPRSFVSGCRPLTIWDLPPQPMSPEQI